MSAPVANLIEVCAAIAINCEIIAACEEERYIRQKSAYGRLPNFSIKKVLEIY